MLKNSSHNSILKFNCTEENVHDKMLFESAINIPVNRYGEAFAYARGSLSTVPVLMLVAADVFLSGIPSDAPPPGDS